MSSWLHTRINGETIVVSHGYIVNVLFYIVLLYRVFHSLPNPAFL